MELFVQSQREENEKLKEICIGLQEDNDRLVGQSDIEGENKGFKKPAKHETLKILKSEIKFLNNKNKQLEEKLKVNEAKSDNQFDNIIRLEEKVKLLKESGKNITAPPKVS